MLGLGHRDNEGSVEVIDMLGLGGRNDEKSLRRSGIVLVTRIWVQAGSMVSITRANARLEFFTVKAPMLDNLRAW